jgi:hypothetical protein
MVGLGLQRLLLSPILTCGTRLHYFTYGCRVRFASAGATATREPPATTASRGRQGLVSGLSSLCRQRPGPLPAWGRACSLHRHALRSASCTALAARHHCKAMVGRGKRPLFRNLLSRKLPFLKPPTRSRIRVRSLGTRTSNDPRRRSARDPSRGYRASLPAGSFLKPPTRNAPPRSPLISPSVLD